MDIGETGTQTPFNFCRLYAVMAALLAALTGCTTVPTGTQLAHTPVEGGGSAFDRTRTRFATDLLDSITEPDCGTKAEKLFRSGMAMLDMQCSRYLDAIGLANQTAGNNRRQMSLVSGFAAAMMGMAGSTAKEIAGLTASFSFSGSSLESANTTFLFSDAASSVTKIVRESQKAWLDTTSTPAFLDGMKNLDAIRMLDAYEQLCRPPAIRALIDQSIARGTIVPQRAHTSDADTVAALESLQAVLGMPVTESQAIILYTWLKHPAQRSAGARLSGSEPLTTLLATRTEQVLAGQLARAFLPTALTDSQVPLRWSASVRFLLAPGGADVTPASSMITDPALKLPPPVPRRPALPVLTVR